MKFKLGSLISYLEERLFTRLLKFAIFSGPVRPNLGFSGSVQYFQVKAHLPEINSPPISSTKTSSPAVRSPSSSVHLFPNQPDLVGKSFCLNNLLISKTIYFCLLLVEINKFVRNLRRLSLMFCVLFPACNAKKSGLN